MVIVLLGKLGRRSFSDNTEALYALLVGDN